MENPIDVLDRTVSSYTGGVNTDEYYAKIYANHQNGVPTETLVLQKQEMPAQTHAGQLPQGVPAQSGYPVSGVDANGTPLEESPVDAFLRQTTGGDTQTNVPVQATPQSVQQGVSVPSQDTYVATKSVSDAQQVDLSPASTFSFIINAAFSFAVVMSVVGIMFIVYIIIRTRQLHHHEHHVKELGGHGGAAPAPHAPTVAPAIHDASHTPVVSHVESAVPQHVPEVSEPVADVLEGSADILGEKQHQMVVETEHEEDVHNLLPAQKPAPVFDADDITLYSSRLRTITEDAAGDDEDGWYTSLMDVNLLLEDILTEKGFEGTSVKEMMQSEQASSLATRDVALEAEAQFQKLISGEEALTHDAIQRLVALYAKVCKELGVV